MAYASIPDSDGTIHACVIKGSGLLRVIDSASELCKATETPLDISQGLSNPSHFGSKAWPEARSGTAAGFAIIGGCQPRTRPQLGTHRLGV